MTAATQIHPIKKERGGGGGGGGGGGDGGVGGGGDWGVEGEDPHKGSLSKGGGGEEGFYHTSIMEVE